MFVKVLEKQLVSDALLVISECPGLSIRAVERRVTGFFESRLKETGLTLAQFGLMSQITAARDDTIAGLSRLTGLDPSTLSRNLHTLEKSGLVESDLRRRAVCLTEKGASQLEAAIPVWQQAREELRDYVGRSRVRKILAATEPLARV